MKCPAFERLIDYLDCRLPEAEAAAVAGHLATGCAACAENRDWYQQVRTVAKSDDTVEPPAWVVKRAARVFETQRKPGLAERIGQAIASLVFDSFARPAPAGVRSTEMPNRQLLYRAGDYSIDLQIASTGDARADLIGQVLKESEAMFESVGGLKLELDCAGQTVLTAVTNEMGEFKVAGIELGIYSLRVELSEGSINVPDLPVIQS